MLPNTTSESDTNLSRISGYSRLLRRCSISDTPHLLQDVTITSIFYAAKSLLSIFAKHQSAIPQTRQRQGGGCGLLLSGGDFDIVALVKINKQCGSTECVHRLCTYILISRYCKLNCACRPLGSVCSWIDSETKASLSTPPRVAYSIDLSQARYSG